MKAQPGPNQGFPAELEAKTHKLTTMRISLKKKPLGDYKPIVGREVIEEIRRLASAIRGLKVLHINSTGAGGGVAELLTNLVPLEVASGLEAAWMTLPQHFNFFKVTKLFHNALQGMTYQPTRDDIHDYLEHNRLSAESTKGRYDLIITHDPQPVAFRHFYGRKGAKWVWRCHIDTSNPCPAVWDFLRPFVNEYDAAVFTTERFEPPGVGIPEEMVFFIPPAIDPLSTKNRAIPESISREVLTEYGVDRRKPLITQVSRFDPWKDPGGVIRIYRTLKKRIPDLQLALIGFMAMDDPEAWRIYSFIEEQTADDRDAFIFTNLNGVGGLEVNAFQTMSNVVVQKSIKEGFGLAVSEAIWKKTPVVAGNTGGIPLQMRNGVGGFLADTEDEYIEHIEYLLKSPKDADEIAAKGKEFVRERFLVTRLLMDELKLFKSLVL